MSRSVLYTCPGIRLAWIFDGATPIETGGLAAAEASAVRAASIAAASASIRINRRIGISSRCGGDVGERGRERLRGDRVGIGHLQPVVDRAGGARGGRGGAAGHRLR